MTRGGERGLWCPHRIGVSTFMPSAAWCRAKRRSRMPGRIQDRVAIVTGAGSSGPGWGNGKATSVLFAREGARVLAVDVNREAAEETCDIIRGEGHRAEAYVADVTDASQVDGLVGHCLSVFGRIDILHNNVGIVEVGGCA